MKKFKSMFAVAMTGVLAMTVMAGCGTSDNNATGDAANKDAKKPKMIMATSADYKPYEFHDTTSGKDEIKGFDIDIANYIAKDLGFELEIQDMDFNGLLGALQSGRADFVMAGMTPKEERKKSADFSDIYFEAKNTIVTKKGANLKTTESLTGKKVGVQLGSIQEGEVKEMKGVEMVSLNKIAEIVQEVKTGRVDAAIIEDVVAKGYVEANQDLEFTTIESAEVAGSAIAFPKGSKHLEDFNKSLKKLKDSGELEKMANKWFQ